MNFRHSDSSLNKWIIVSKVNETQLYLLLESSINSKLLSLFFQRY
jgi:hypothetical protein